MGDAGDLHPKKAPPPLGRVAQLPTPVLIAVLGAVLLIATAVTLNDRSVIRAAFIQASTLLESDPPQSTSASSSPAPASCDLSRGEWVHYPNGAYYTNDTCSLIEKRHDCMKNGKPSLEYLNWRWRPHGCELPRFDAQRFLRAVTNKTMAFIGDSLARNQLQSLMCLLSKVEDPERPAIPLSSFLFYEEHNGFLRVHYRRHNFTARLYWSKFLVRAEWLGLAKMNLFNLHLDEPDTNWGPDVGEMDYAVVSAGSWMYSGANYFLGEQLVGCHDCYNVTVKNLPIAYAQREVFRTTLLEFVRRNRRRGTVFLRTLTPEHFEGGKWNTGGKCVRTRPWRANETAGLEGVELELYRAQLEAFKEAEAAAAAADGGATVRLMNVSVAMKMRPDAHPGKHVPPKYRDFVTDCLHWCLPGAIDVWNEWLLHLIDPPSS